MSMDPTVDEQYEVGTFESVSEAARFRIPLFNIFCINKFSLWVILTHQGQKSSRTELLHNADVCSVLIPPTKFVAAQCANYELLFEFAISNFKPLFCIILADDRGEVMDGLFVWLLFHHN